MKEQCSFKSAAKAFYDFYGYPLTREKLAKAFGYTEKGFYQHIELRHLGTSMYKYWREKNENKH